MLPGSFGSNGLKFRGVDHDRAYPSVTSLVFGRSYFLREGPRSQGASWGVCGFGVPPYEFLKLYGVFDSRFCPGALPPQPSSVP
jgi:hypothetical protein